jgi:hypothetical protein
LRLIARTFSNSATNGKRRKEFQKLVIDTIIEEEQRVEEEGPEEDKGELSDVTTIVRSNAGSGDGVAKPRSPFPASGDLDAWMNSLQLEDRRKWSNVRNNL